MPNRVPRLLAVADGQMAYSLARSNSKRPGSRCGSNPLSAGLISRALRAKPVNVDQLMRFSDGLVKPSVPCEHGG
jgi:hypothetical protein